MAAYRWRIISAHIFDWRNTSNSGSVVRPEAIDIPQKSEESGGEASQQSA